jgi:hypothetical protein
MDFYKTNLIYTIQKEITYCFYVSIIVIVISALGVSRKQNMEKVLRMLNWLKEYRKPEINDEIISMVIIEEEERIINKLREVCLAWLDKSFLYQIFFPVKYPEIIPRKWYGIMPYKEKWIQKRKLE